MVANGTMTEAPLILNYDYVVSRDVVCSDLLIAGPNDLDIMACDVGNAYLNVSCQERFWFAAGPDCAPEKIGMVMVMVMIRYLYELNISGAGWRKHL